MHLGRLHRHQLPILVSIVQLLLIPSAICPTHILDHRASPNRRSIIYTATCASFVPIIYFFFPETSGRSLEEIDAIFTESDSVFSAVQTAKKLPRMHLAELEVEDKIEKAEHDEAA
jgi:hypothetical protein